MDLLLTKDLVEKELRELGTFALKNFGNTFINNKKSNRDFTTKIDVEIESRFSDFVKKNFPDQGFIGEEIPALNNKEEYFWAIDPIDGTKNYARDIPLWCITIALVRNNEPLIGFIFNPVSDQMYIGIKSQGAYLNGKKLTIKNDKELTDSQAVIDIPITPEMYLVNGQILDKLNSILNRSFYRVRNVGSGALSLAWLSQGMFSIYIDLFKPNDKLVDVYAGRLISQEAGAEIYNLKFIDMNYNASIIGSKKNVDNVKNMIDKILQ
ncbi:MAG: inositol monophosphatase [Candidatus Dojkabacteria bacterium]|nr:inositol monophosphatase [Candidatus Dojkabacteria bacterium]MDQ7020732.1 inositol monophosphatase [Candidatus Dojkabacteria bacterium]